MFCFTRQFSGKSAFPNIRPPPAKIAYAQNSLHLWIEEDAFIYDVLHMPHGERLPLRPRSFVGVMPLLTVENLKPEDLAELRGSKAK